jgi:hypothetical protein
MICGYQHLRDARRIVAGWLQLDDQRRPARNEVAIGEWCLPDVDSGAKAGVSDHSMARLAEGMKRFRVRPHEIQ